ncbi:hypothetical protein B0H19DRAFT_1300317 [Mycena capillaripes]|nr:hypothetical protein B0H19DRAFT_1300317 [Mycena capillaripes]
MALSNASNPIIHPDIRKHFDGSNLMAFETMITHILTGRHVDGYGTGKIVCPDKATGPTTATDWSSATPTWAEWTARDEWVRSTIALNIIDITELGLKATGTAKELWDCIIQKYRNKSTMAVAHAKDNIAQEMGHDFGR